MDIESKIERDLGHSHNCLICCGEVEVSGTQFHSTIDKQVQVIFILNKVLELPSSHLVGFLQQWGNPECWIRLCDNCNEHIENVKEIYWSLIRISRKWDEERRIMREKIRCSNDGKEELDPEGKGETAQSHISRECLTFISQVTSLREVNDVEIKVEDDWNAVELNNEYDNETEQSDCGSGKKGSFDSEGDEDWVPENPQKRRIREETRRSCSKTFKNSLSLQARIKKVHSRANSTRILSDGGELRHLTPVRNQGPNTRIPCAVKGCPKTFARKDCTYKYHVAKHTGQEPSFKCTECQRPFYTLGLLRKHTREIHMRLRVAECSKCGKEVTRKSNLDKHMRNCGNFECEFCERKFTSAIAFRLHQKKHTKPKTEVPAVQNKEGIPCPAVQSKERIPCPAVQSKERIPCPAVECKKIIPCPVQDCMRTFPGKTRSYQYHVGKHTGQEPGFKCTQCEKAFYTKDLLNKHTRDVHLRLQVAQCTKCGKEVTRKSNLAQHMRNCGNFECEFCGRKFTSLIHFKLHKRKHTRPKTEPKPKPPSQRPCICHICGQSYAKKSNLKKHVTLVHERNFTIFCHLCGMGTQENCSLKKHLASIHNIGDFKCDVEGCSKVFGTQYHLAEHKKFIHERHKRPERKRKQFCCEFCGFKTSTSSTLNEHLTSVHQVS